MKTLKLLDRIKELEKQVAKFKKLSIVDELTELYNRRKFNHDIELACHNYRRYDEHFLIVYVDINDFKKINDSRGHLYGDKILKEVGWTINAQTRTGDRVYRVGGDEFAILLYHSGMESAISLIRRVKKEITKYKVNISCGIQEGAAEVRTILNDVDQKMYEEKRK